MNPELKKLLDSIRAYANKDEIIDALKAGGEYTDLRNDIYQVAFNDGHATATEAHRGAKTKAEEKIAAANAAKELAEKALDKLKKENPEAAALHADYGKEIERLKGEIAATTATHLSEKKAMRQKAVRDSIEKELLALRVDPHKAEAMADANLKQVSVADDLSERILQPGKTVAYAGDITGQVKALAADLFKTVPKELILSKVPGGGPAESGSVAGDTGGESSEKRTALQKAKEAAQNKFKGAGQTNVGGTVVSAQDEVNRRLGQRQRV